MNGIHIRHAKIKNRYVCVNFILKQSTCIDNTTFMGQFIDVYLVYILGWGHNNGGRDMTIAHEQEGRQPEMFQHMSCSSQLSSSAQEKEYEIARATASLRYMVH